MATRQTAASDNLQIKLDGVWHKLSVTVRHNDGITHGQLTALVKATISMWCKAWQAATSGMRDWTMASPCEQFVIEPSADDPYVTVWNMNSGISLTAHSHSNGSSVTLPYFAYVDATEAMQDAAPEMFNLSMTQRTVPQNTPTNITHLPQQNTAPQSGLQLKAWVRSTVVGLADNLLGFESGKTDSPNYDKQAIIATVPYVWNTVQFDKKYSFAAYPMTGKIVIKDFDGNGVFSIGIETSNNATIWVKDRGGDHNYDWLAVTKKLGIDNQLDQLVDGFEGHIQADYVVMSLSKPKTDSDGNDVQYKNFYGFFSAPESEALAATGTECASDTEWLEQREPQHNDEPDYSSIPF